MLNSNRLNLLTDAEIEALYACPEFNRDEQAHYFSLSESDQALLSTYHKLKAKIYFVLQLGYFRATKQFYHFTLENAKQDVAYLIDRYFYSPKRAITGTLWKESYQQQKAIILQHYDYQAWDIKFKPMVLNHLEKLVRLYPKGNDTLRELLVFFENKKITIPSYRTLQDLVTETFRKERTRLSEIVVNIPRELQQQFDDLIKNDDGFSQLNVMRLDQKDFKYQALKIELGKVERLAALYQLSQRFVPSLELSKNAVRYYATLAEHYTASRVRKLSKPQQWLHVLCFIYHRYQEFMDNLITSFIFHVRVLQEEAKKYAKEKEEEYLKSVFMNFPNLADFLEWYSAGNAQSDLTAEQFRQQGFGILSKEKQKTIAHFIAGKSFNRKAEKWAYYEKSARHLALYFRPILLAVKFEFYKPDSLTMQLITILHDYYSAGKSPKKFVSSLPQEIFEKIPPGILSMLKSDDKAIHPARFYHKNLLNRMPLLLKSPRDGTHNPKIFSLSSSIKKH